MGIFFGTDGIRGIACEELTHELAHKCGNALGSCTKNAKIIIGADTRKSGSYIKLAFAVGAISAGANIVDVGICTTPALSYLVRKLKYDYAVVISASHNSAKYNGIKIFTSDGFKLCDDKENALERKFVRQTNCSYTEIGSYRQNFKLTTKYVNYIKNQCASDLSGLKIVIDASNGASYKIAPKIFKELGAEIVTISCKKDGDNINNNCGSLYPESLIKQVKSCNADMGFAFDGDADRIIACDESGNILDGDIILYILAKYLKSKSKLKSNCVVGTRHTNMGIENSLKENGISLIRTDIGDKYVIAKMEELKLSLGGEKSGHIIMRDYLTTGDGVLSAVMIAKICKETKNKLSKLAEVHLYPQCNLDVVVEDKMRIINSEKLSDEIKRTEKSLGKNSRVMVRASGTEKKIRIMVECANEVLAEIKAMQLKKIVEQIDAGI